MDSYFYVKWKDYIVAFLAKKEEKYYFIYNHNEEMLQQAYKNGFTFIPTFMDKKLYVSNELFGFFKGRIPEEERNDIWGKMLEVYDECELLTITGAKSLTDYYSVEKAKDNVII